MLRAGVVAIGLLLLSGSPLPAAEWVQESPGQKAYYDSRGQLERVELDSDGDGRFEAEERYRHQRRSARREDQDGDGQWERHYVWHEDGTAVLTEQKRKGKLQKTFYGADGAVERIEKDGDGDGKTESVWEYSAGQLQRISKPRGVWHYKNGKKVRAELDENRDGRIERIEYYGEAGSLSRIEELSAAGKVKCTWTYGTDGKPLRAEEDTDGDGCSDRFRRFHSDGTLEQTVDADHNGTPEIRELFSASGRLISREEDLDGDGVFDLRTGRIADH